MTSNRIEKLEERANLTKDFTIEYMDCFRRIFKKHMKRNGKISIVCAFNVFTNIIMSLVGCLSAKQIIDSDLDFIGMVNRFAESLKKCENKWGKISGEDFNKNFSEEYEKTQYKYFEVDDEDLIIIKNIIDKATN